MCAYKDVHDTESYDSELSNVYHKPVVTSGVLKLSQGWKEYA